MARGKYSHRKANRDHKSLEAEIDSLTTQISDARKRLGAAQTAARDRSELDAKLRSCLNERDTAVADERQRLTADIEVLRNVLARSQEVSEPVNTAWVTYLETYIEQRKAGSAEPVEAIESVMGLLNEGMAGVIDFDGWAVRRKLGAEATVRIDQARGARSANYKMPRRETVVDASALAPRALRPQWKAWLASHTDNDRAPQPPERVKELIDQWQRATPYTLTPTAALAGHPHPRVDATIDTEHPVARLLGLDLNGPETASPRQQPPTIDPLLSDRAFYALRDPWEVADGLLPLWRLGRNTIGDTGRLPTPLHPPPRHPSPADAVALRHWYSLAAAGAWARSDGTESSRGYGETAVALAAASNFWMPPGQVHGYLDSDPITNDDRARIRLAYPNVFLALGKPIVLEANPAAEPVDTERLEAITLRLVQARKFTNSSNWVLSNLTAVNQINVLDLIAARGALIEGVLLLSDYQGIPNGRLAWCVAVPARTGVLGRWALPAQRDRTAYADQVDALLAVAAWADWHEPADPEATTTSHRRSAALQHAAAAGKVHVLNATRTASTAARPNPTGRTVTAHIRRGHWRRQHVGVGRSQIRMVRVSPAIVGAGNRPLSTPIYRLPSNPAVPG
ncbi:hypothetical protein H7I77_09795 [Mycolicibacterium novocastrense]|uniref:Uncharacterized protein n=1 Tax=Mycolicibacterium novocastrense TaxID=59813 RepID=A0AAW5SKT7_MYCNV|nr:hypothetical protein [Mycolicibacterium novocastrense]MCV7023638.1 hypothetical protein [Mycolicibacterium novocastrense]GAT07718.1 uncharacterized protein RMCN_0851 [Mycolicibacterium novocastrense]